MDFLSALLFGSGSSDIKMNTSNSWWGNPADSYDDYFMSRYEDAICGDSEAIREMEDEFGEDWEGEY